MNTWKAEAIENHLSAISLVVVDVVETRVVLHLCRGAWRSRVALST